MELGRVQEPGGGNIEKEDLHEGKIITLSNVLSKDECEQRIARAENVGFNPSPVSGGGHGRTGKEDPRTSEFVVFVDGKEADLLWTRVKEYIPSDLSHLSRTAYITSPKDATTWNAVGVNPRMRIYKYHKGQSFPEHIDYKMRRTVWRGGEKYIQQTFTTLLIYLNDHNEFEGGETGFWTQHDMIGVKEHCRFLRGVENKPHQVKVTPKQGMCLLNDQNILHEGMPPTRGVKYVLRTDIIHEKHRPLHPRLQKEREEQVRKGAMKERVLEEDREEEWEKMFESSCKNYAD